MLVLDPSQRAPLNQLLSHEWVRVDGVASDQVIEPEVLQRMRRFAAMNRLKKEALKVWGCVVGQRGGG
jgi:calcium-dependent protein kinase